MSVLETIATAVQPWATFYSDSKVASAVVVFAHVGGMLWGGGLALSADRLVMRARSAGAEERARLLAEIEKIHTPVLVGLGISAISGVLLTASDIKTYGPSPVWWAKFVAFVLLLANGAWLQQQERRMQKAAGTVTTKWSPLTLASAFSMFLWFAVTLGGVLLTVV
jgi:hypothetical protein